MRNSIKKKKIYCVFSCVFTYKHKLFYILLFKRRCFKCGLYDAVHFHNSSLFHNVLFI